MQCSYRWLFLYYRNKQNRFNFSDFVKVIYHFCTTQSVRQNYGPSLDFMSGLRSFRRQIKNRIICRLLSFNRMNYHVIQLFIYKKTLLIENTRKPRWNVSFSLARFNKTSLKPNGKSQHEKYAASMEKLKSPGINSFLP